MSSTPYQVISKIRKALKDCNSFQFVGYYPFDVKEAISDVQNTKATNYATCIIEDNGESESSELMIAGYDNIDLFINIYYFIVKPKGLTLKELHDYEIIIKNIMNSKSTFTGLTGEICSFSTGAEVGLRTKEELNEFNMLGYSDDMISKKLTFRINMQVARNGAC